MGCVCTLGGKKQVRAWEGEGGKEKRKKRQFGETGVPPPPPEATETEQHRCGNLAWGAGPHSSCPHGGQPPGCSGDTQKTHFYLMSSLTKAPRSFKHQGVRCFRQGGCR